MKFLKKLRFWFTDKDRLIELLIQQQKENTTLQLTFVKKLEELDQHKTYYIYVPDGTAEDMQQISRAIKQLEQHSRWSLPNIIVTNQRFEEKN